MKVLEKDIELTEEFIKTYDLMENTSKNIFITGKAGTGKSTLLQHFSANTKKNVVVLAPTGVAAVNVKGQTIHSFFKFQPDITLSKVARLSSWRSKRSAIYKQIDTILIDEISMVRADLLDCVDKFLRLNRNNSLSFGGVQMIFFGDLYQLPPVVTRNEREIFRENYKSEYFFDALVFKSDNSLFGNTFPIEFVELEKLYRQKDEIFISLLNSIRNNNATQEDLDMLNSRYDPYFEADIDDRYVYLTTTNNLAYQINSFWLSKLKGDVHTFVGSIEGVFDKKYLPTDLKLNLKTGSQIMLLNNDQEHRWVNGTIGKINDVHKNEKGKTCIEVELLSGKIVDVKPFTWGVYKFNFDKTTKNLVSETVGSFTQFPIKLAWAVTIHKSQGKTFDKVIIDIGNGLFAHGQLYVALSRCTTLEGIKLKKKIKKEHMLMDKKVVDFLCAFGVSN